MAIVTAVDPEPPTPAGPRRRRVSASPRLRRVPRSAPPSQPAMLISYALSVLSALMLAVLLNLTVISQFEHSTSQRNLYGTLRQTLAEGSTPIGQTDLNGALVVPGTPVALLQIPAIGVNEVVVEGTSSSQTREGVGHRRDTPLPGQAGISVLMGRQAAYGGVFGDLGRLRAGDLITVTTGQGVSTYRAIGPRTHATEVPSAAADRGWLTLATASGVPFMPDGTLLVDATLVTKPFPRPAPVFAGGAITASEGLLAGDRGGLVALSWLLELLVLISVLAVVAWKRWDRRAAWIVFLPLILVTTLACADRICVLLPNLV